MTRTLPTPALHPRPPGETPSSRGIVAGTAASVVIAGCLYSGTELVLALLGKPPLITAPRDVVRQVGQAAPAILLIAGLVVAVVGTVLVLLVLRSRRAQHTPDSDDAAVAGGDELAADTAGSEPRVAPETGAVSSRFTVAKAIADAIAYDALRASRSSAAPVGATAAIRDDSVRHLP